MDNASLELSAELERLSGWETIEHHLIEDIPFPVTVPAYSVSYLLNKLPPTRGKYGLGLFATHNQSRKGHFMAAYVEDNNNIEKYGSKYLASTPDTPANTLCKLAILLHKEGILAHLNNTK